MKRKATIDKIDSAVNDFVDASYDRFKTYGYASGYLSSMLKRALAEVPASVREDMLNQLKADTHA